MRPKTIDEAYKLANKLVLDYKFPVVKLVDDRVTIFGLIGAAYGLVIREGKNREFSTSSIDENSIVLENGDIYLTFYKKEDLANFIQCACQLLSNWEV